MKILAVDVGGNNVKVLLSGLDPSEKRKVKSGQDLGPERMVGAVRELTEDWDYNAVSLGLPTSVRDGRPTSEPKNLGAGWMDFDYQAGFRKPVRVVNDAAMQALGSYEGGRMLFMGLGTGLGTAMVVDGTVLGLELAHLPYRKGTYEDYLGDRGLDERGGDKWRATLFEVVESFLDAFLADYIVLGGGNVKRLDELPPGCRRGSNRNAFKGGFRLWEK